LDPDDVEFVSLGHSVTSVDEEGCLVWHPSMGDIGPY